MRVILAVTALALLLAACSESKKDIKDSVFAPQVKAMEKARSVENTLQQGAEKNRDAIESSERPGEPEQR
jgi:PBP1b-binding outer membrane lipoprotein LpoB